MRGEDPEMRAVWELRSMMGHILRSPPLFAAVSFPRSISYAKASPAAFGLLFMGISVALMLLGILTFVIGFFLMPLVFMLLLIFYFVSIVAKISEIARNILYPCNKVQYGITQGEVSAGRSLTSD